MKEFQKNILFKKGIWIKDQNGSLTIGSLDKTDTSVKIIPDNLRRTLVEFETDMIEALYGEHSKPFIPEVIDLNNLLKNLKEQYQTLNIKVALAGTQNNIFKGDYEKIYAIVENLIQSSIAGLSKDDELPLIYVNVSLVDNHLCLIYRDSASACHPSKIEPEIEYIQTILNGEVRFKDIGGDKSYFDIMIPSKE